MNSPDNVNRAKSDPEYRNKFIADNEKFILTSAYKAVGRFVTKSDDAWSIALIAFNEAIDAYDENKGSFASFSALIIKRRVIDHLRSEGRHDKEVAFDMTDMELSDEEDGGSKALETQVRSKVSQMSEQDPGSASSAITVTDEIEALKSVLDSFSFSFFDLTECSPKAAKTKKACGEAVRCLLEHKELYSKMITSKMLPIAEIEKNTSLPRKILERHRKYIITAGIILGGDYPLLSEYMRDIKNGDTGKNVDASKAGIPPIVTGVLLSLSLLCDL